MEFKAGEIIVKFNKGVPQATIQSLLLIQGMNVLDEMADLGFMLLSVPEGRELEKIEELKWNPVVEYAEPNYLIKIANTTVAEPLDDPLTTAVIPDDPYLPSQWNLGQIEAFAAWEITTGSDRVVIAIVDSGIDLDHPELKDKIWTNPGETGVDTSGNDKATNDIDDDGNGKIDDVHGWDFVNWNRKPNKPQDDFGHGTFVAGIAAAETDNGILIAGVSWGAEIMPVKVMNQNGETFHWDTASGIRYAANQGAKIINLSWSLYSYINPEPLQAAISYAHDKGALIVAGSGDPNPKDPIPRDAYQYPAALDHVVSVAATDRYDERWSDSTYNDMVDVAAPGVDVFSFMPGEYYPRRWSSTGLAAAHVSGLAALIWSVNPNLTPDQVEGIIKSTAVDLGEPGRDDYFGYGRIDASVAVRATPHHLEVEYDDPFYFLVCDDSNPPSRKITNPNTSCSTWDVTATAPWLSISDCEDYYTPSSVTVTIDKYNLPGHGLYADAITVTSKMTSHMNNPQTITATVNYPLQCCHSYLPLLFKNHSPY
jgi:subtilisin family serine protease